MTAKEFMENVGYTRLKTYPGPHPSEAWKNDQDLSHCTDTEKKKLAEYGITWEDLKPLNLTRGEIHHILFGFRYPNGKRK